MSPRARRSESITLPPGNHPGLVRYKDEVQVGAPETFESSHHTCSEKSSCALGLEPNPYLPSDDEYDEYFIDESNLDSASDASYDANDSHDDDIFPSH